MLRNVQKVLITSKGFCLEQKQLKGFYTKHVWIEIMTLHDNGAFPLQDEISRGHLGKNNHLYLKQFF